MLKINPLLLSDSYKLTHKEQYPKNTEYVYSNITARASRMKDIDKVITFGLQYFIKEYLIRRFNEDFFDRPKGEVIQELENFFARYMPDVKLDMAKYEDLHDLGYLPLSIKSLPEGTRCPIGVPYCTIINTHSDFYWLTNFIETIMQNVMWNPLTCATIADQYRKLLNSYADTTCDNRDHVAFQAHNFSMRGMSSFESSLTTDAAHLLSFVGSDTVPGQFFLEEYYNADLQNELVSCSVPATEHSVQCAGGKANERETFKRLITETYPNGIVSIVSDTWDLWKVLTEIAPSLEEEIEARDGKVVFRPDTGNPIKIICGYFVEDFHGHSEELLAKSKSSPWLQSFLPCLDDETDALRTTDGKCFDLSFNELSIHEVKGAIEILADKFGTTTNEAEYQELNPKVGLIYGDSITLERCEAICSQLEAKGYASNNVVFGVGSFTYQYNTRDTFYIACKATWAQIDGVGHNIFKDPVTDDGKKKSACGLLRVDRVEGSHGSTLVLKDQCTKEEEAGGELIPVFEDGKLLVDETLEGTRERLACGVDYPV